MKLKLRIRAMNKSRHGKTIFSFIILAVLIQLLGCGGSGGGETVTIDLTGNWRGTWNSSIVNNSGNLSGTQYR